jgi:hypothetical protein
MPDHFFSPPVRVALGKAGNVTHAVTRAERAAEILLNEWPARPTKKQLDARRAVLHALMNMKDAAAAMKARAAFEAAAEEAGILMPERPKSIAPADFKTPDWNRPKPKLKRDL